MTVWLAAFMTPNMGEIPELERPPQLPSTARTAGSCEPCWGRLRPRRFFLLFSFSPSAGFRIGPNSPAWEVGNPGPKAHSISQDELGLPSVKAPHKLPHGGNQTGNVGGLWVRVCVGSVHRFACHIGNLSPLGSELSHVGYEVRCVTFLAALPVFLSLR